MSKFKERILSLLSAMALTATLIPSASLFASAETDGEVMVKSGTIMVNNDWADETIDVDLTEYKSAKVVISENTTGYQWLKVEVDTSSLITEDNYGASTISLDDYCGQSFQLYIGANGTRSYEIIGIPGQIVKHTVTASVAEECAEMGTVTGTKEYKEGALATVKATPANGYKFVKWVDEAGKEYTKSSHTFTVSEDKSFTAYFEKKAGSETTKTDTVRIEAEGATLFNNNAHQTKPGDTWYGEASANDWLEMTGSCEAYLPIVITDTSVTYDITFRYVAEGEDTEPLGKYLAAG